MSSCAVELDNYQNDYHPGNTIEGKVVCTFYKPKTVKEIRIELRAEERVFWTTLRPHYDQATMLRCTKSVEYKGNNNIFSLEKSLAGEGELQPGHYEYPFKFILPHDVPGTHSGDNMSIKFFLKATVDRKYQVNYEHEIEINVMAPIDLNVIKKDLILEPFDRSVEKTVLSLFCCRNLPVAMDAHFPKNAFLPGEEATVKVVISNMTLEKIPTVKLTLETELEIMATTPAAEVKSFRETLMTGEESGVPANTDKAFNFKLLIPKSATVPNFSLCKLVKQQTRINIVAEIPYAVVLYVSVPIIIGQIPIQNKEEIEKMRSNRQNAHVALSNQLSDRPTAPLDAGPSAPPPEDTVPDLPPPSYEAIYKD